MQRYTAVKWAFISFISALLWYLDPVMAICGPDCDKISAVIRNWYLYSCYQCYDFLLYIYHKTGAYVQHCWACHVWITRFGKFTTAGRLHSNFGWWPEANKGCWHQKIYHETVLMRSVFDGVVSHDTQQLQVIVDITELTYSLSLTRSVKSVLRFHNVSYLF